MKAILLSTLLILNVSQLRSNTLVAEYNKYEKNTFKHYNNIFNNNGLNWDSITIAFETYFQNIDLVNDDNIDASYYSQITEHLLHSGGISETANDIRNQMKELVDVLNSQNLTSSVCISCLTKFHMNYEKNKRVGRPPWGFHVLGVCIVKYNEHDGNLPPEAIFGGIMQMKPLDFNNELYKRTIIIWTYLLSCNK